MRFVFPAAFSVMIAMLFVSFYPEALASHNPLQAVTATAAAALDVTPEPKLAAVAAISGPAPDVTPEPKLDAARKAQLAPEVLPKVKPAAGPAIPPASDTLPETNAAPISVPPSATRAPNDPAVQLDSDEMTRLIKRGKEFLAQGNFASARLLFKRAADAGSAEAALALGSTYDPSVIKQLGAVSITPDIDAALKWYETAAERGSAEAEGLFANLTRLRTAAMAAKPTAAKPRSETEPVEEKANSRTITEPEVAPSTQPLATPGFVAEKEPTEIGAKAESQAIGQPSQTSDPVPKKEANAGRTEGSASGQPAETSDPDLNAATTAIGGKAESQATGQLAETSDPVLKKAKITLAAKMEDPASVEFVDIKRAMDDRIICGHIKGKRKSGEATGERPFLYLVKEDEAYIGEQDPDSMPAIVYRDCASSR
jgi:hypothetical protein